jgi:hypothetical protein
MFGRSDDGSQTTDMSQAIPGDPPVSPPPVPDAPLDTALPADSTVISPSPLPTASAAHLTVPGPTVDTTAAATADPTSPPVPDDLLAIKQGALQALSPLISHLDQTPEEKFRTTMMLIQATDDQTKLKEAYDAAQAITDDKARAQALLDVVNEINYFTQQQKPADQ